MAECSWPTCSSHAQPNGYCVAHRMYSNSAAVKVAKPIAPQSSKKKADNKELKVKYPAFLSKPENKYCKVQMEGCTKVATVVHHTRGRIGDLLFDERFWMASCPSCNIILESKDAEARTKGVKKSKFNTND